MITLKFDEFQKFSPRKIAIEIHGDKDWDERTAMNEVMQVLKKVVDLPPSQPCNYLLLNLNKKHSGSHSTIYEISKLYLFSEMIKQKHHELRTPQRTPQQISNKRAQIYQIYTN